MVLSLDALPINDFDSIVLIGVVPEVAIVHRSVLALA